MNTWDTEVRSAVRLLTDAGVPSAAFDARELAAVALESDVAEVDRALVLKKPLNAVQADRFHELVALRAQRIPLQHLTGVAHFRHLTLAVGPGVFVPRPETEVLIDAALAALEHAGPTPLVVDLGTGSGAIAISVATEVPSARVIALEASVDAARWAVRNIAASSAASRLDFREGNAAGATETSGILADVIGQVDVVVTNPPYIPNAARPRDPEVALYDPPTALYGGPDGLLVPAAFIATAQRLLRPDGTIVLEHGEFQGAEVRALLAPPYWCDVNTRPDLTGRDRITTARVSLNDGMQA